MHLVGFIWKRFYRDARSTNIKFCKRCNLEIHVRCNFESVFIGIKPQSVTVVSLPEQCYRIALYRWILRIYCWSLKQTVYSESEPGYHSRSSDKLRAEPSWDRLPIRGEIFRTRPERTWGPSSLLYNGYRVFLGGKAVGTRRRPPTAIKCRGQRKSSAVPLLPLWTFVTCYKVNFVLNTQKKKNSYRNLQQKIFLNAAITSHVKAVVYIRHHQENKTVNNWQIIYLFLRRVSLHKCD